MEVNITLLSKDFMFSMDKIRDNLRGGLKSMHHIDFEDKYGSKGDEVN